ncbi:MAG: GNAT family N-acetyltransferase [Candidatus Magasanikbacteria bacterium]
MKIKQAKTKTELDKAYELLEEVFIDEVGLTKKELRKYDEQNVDTYLVLLKDQVVSVVQVFFENGNITMDWLATREEYRGKGYAKKLMDYILEKLSKQDIEKVEINSHIDLVSLYQDWGFEKTGEPKPDESGEMHVEMEYRFN